MDVMRGLGEHGDSTRLAGVENLMLHFTPYAEDWSKLPVIVSGEGSYVTDVRGHSYIDGLAGLFTTQVGHGRTELADAAHKQMKELGFFPNWSFQHPRSLELAAKIAEIAPGDLNSTFFVSSGSEAVETVIKLARQYHKTNGEGERRKFVSRKVAYHGTTMGALSVTGIPAFKAPFEPLLDGVVHVPNTRQDPKGAADAIEEAIEFAGPETVAAVFLEPVQNGGGCLVPPPDYWRRVREICDKHGVLLVSDAVICAFGRLGEWFGVERFGVVPDMSTFAKGVTSGYSPMGGVVVSDKVAQTLKDNAPMFVHGSTFGGHPVSSAVALENIAIIERENLLQNVHDLEGHFGDELKRMGEGHPIVKEVRGMGFFWGVEIKAEWPDGTPISGRDYQERFKGLLTRKMVEGGLICRFEDKEDPVIQFSPALVSDREVLSKIAEITDGALTELERRIGVGSVAAASQSPGRRGVEGGSSGRPGQGKSRTTATGDIYRLFVGGGWRAESSGKTFEVSNPATGEALATVPDGGRAEMRAAIDAAHAAQPGWGGTTAGERAEVLRGAARLVRDGSERLARVLTLEEGKPHAESRAEVLYAAALLERFAEETLRIRGETMPSDSQDKRFVLIKRPVGVSVAMTPWNFPASSVALKVGAALAAGCAVVAKPSELAPLSALELAGAFEEAGLPKGVLSVVAGSDPAALASEALEDRRVRKLSFTGSTEVGKSLMRQSAATVKRLTLELGGHAPFIVFDDADLGEAVEMAVASKMRNAGQTCVCANRIFVQRTIEDEFAERLAERMGALKVGDGLEEGAEVGPLIEPRAVEKVERHVADAKGKGAEVSLGGRRIARPGNFFEPTILLGVNDSMLVAREETFGPVAAVLGFDTEEEVVERSNDTRYGLAAYYFTRDIGRAWRLAEELEFGTIAANDGMPSTDQTPSGGLKESGFGREGGRHGVEEYLDLKCVSFGGVRGERS